MIYRDYQEYAIEGIFRYFAEGNPGNPIVAMPTGCHAKGQRLLMFDGSTKLVEDILPGDLLMGPDSTPRTVLSLCRGHQEMRRIVPKAGDAWVVNKDHILALYRSRQRKNPTAKQRSAYGVFKTVAEFESSSAWHQHIHKLYRVAVTFQAAGPLPMDPYFLGVFLGDGGYTQAQVGVTSMDPEILDFCANYFSSLGDTSRISCNGSKASTIWATTGKRDRTRRSAVAGILDSLGLRGLSSPEKFVPQQFKTASREDRLALLAGLLDTDGYLDNATFEYATTSVRLKDDVTFVARSLGFGVAVARAENGHLGAWRVTITGGTDTIPTKLGRKKAPPRAQKKNVLVTGFRVEQLPEDEYYGFTLDKDNLYLLDDFTVTHNTGKSVVIGGFIERLYRRYPAARVIKLTHVKELIAQNLEKLLAIWPSAPAGVYSAGLKRKELFCPITYAGIATAHKVVKQFGFIDIVLIDECHLVSQNEDTMYRAFIKGLQQTNPNIRVVGFTATPWRLGVGKMTDPGQLFTDICVDMTGMQAFNWFLDQGYLCTLVPKETSVELDTSQVHIRGGEFRQDELQAAVDVDDVTMAAVAETISLAGRRRHWLTFASGVEHAIHVAAAYNQLGVPTGVVHSKMPSGERDQAIADFKAGRYVGMVNNGVLTTGFDFPGIDLISMLRPTKSPGLWVQMLGRGTRPDYFSGPDLATQAGRLEAIAMSDKQDCLVLDFARNTINLGPINDPVMPKAKGKGGGEAPVRLCESCGRYCHASATVCPFCGAEFPRMLHIHHGASTAELIRTKEEAPVVRKAFKVDRVVYHEHRKDGRPPAIKVHYYCGLRVFHEWVCLEHDGFAAKKARDWWRETAMTHETPETTAQALAHLGGLRTPTHILVWVKKPYDEVRARDFTGTSTFQGVTYE